MIALVEWFDPRFAVDEVCFLKRNHITGAAGQDMAVRKQIPELISAARESADIRALYLYEERGFESGVRPADACRIQILCLCYIRGRVADMIQDLTREEKYLEAFLLDQIVDDALFCASDQLAGRVYEDMKKRGLFLTEKYAAGERGIPLERQKHFLDIIKTRIEVDVGINGSFVLIPEKSMLYLFGADENNEERTAGHDCLKCDRKDCLFRLDPGDPQ